MTEEQAAALWCVNIYGPDDLIAVPSYLEAVARANAFNVWWTEYRSRKPLDEQLDARMWAVPIEWPHDAVSHAASLVKPSDEYAWLTAALSSAEPFQMRVHPWMMACFGPEISNDRVERGDRFLEEVFELLQSGGYDPARVLALRDYVWDREKGDPAQEAGGVMVTLAAYCLAHDLDMHAAAETELARIWTKVDQIRAKQAAKPKYSPLPVAAPVAPAHQMQPPAGERIRSTQDGSMEDASATGQSPVGASSTPPVAPAEPPIDWLVSDSELAGKILGYLGMAEAVSLEPGADRRRDEVAKLIRQHLGEPGPAEPVVKRLEWTRSAHITDTLSRAETDIGIYRAMTHCGSDGRWFWSLDGYHKASGEVGNEIEAKAAAQADYESRIRSALVQVEQWRPIASLPNDDRLVLAGCRALEDGGGKP